jgi:uroporphyrinogen-III synthase
MHILVTRPEPDGAALKAALEAAGHTVSLSPLLEIAFSGVPLDLDGAGALAVTSRNALRALAKSPDLERALTLPIFAVGPGTAESARAMGFETCIEGTGTADDLADLIVSRKRDFEGAVLHLAGDRRAGDLEGRLKASGIATRTAVLYHSIAAKTFSAGIAKSIADGKIDAVIVMSPRTAEVLADLLKSEGLIGQFERMHFLCISHPAAARLTNLGIRNLSVASRPSAQEMLALVARVAAKSA